MKEKVCLPHNSPSCENCFDGSIEEPTRNSMLSAFIKKRDKEFEEAFLVDEPDLPDDMRFCGSIEDIRDFHSASLRLFAEEIRKEIEIRAAVERNSGSKLESSVEEVLSDLLNSVLK